MLCYVTISYVCYVTISYICYVTISNNKRITICVDLYNWSSDGKLAANLKFTVPKCHSIKHDAKFGNQRHSCCKS